MSVYRVLQFATLTSRASLPARPALRAALLSAAFAASIAAVAPVEAASVPLGGEALTEMVPGSTIHIDAPLGNILPIAYAADGTMTGKAGGLASHLGSPTDSGKWWVHNGRLCHKWSRWFDGATKCLAVRRDGKRLFWVADDGKSGTATLQQSFNPLRNLFAKAAPTTSAALGGPALRAEAQTEADEAALTPGLAVAPAETAPPATPTGRQPTTPSPSANPSPGATPTPAARPPVKPTVAMARDAAPVPDPVPVQRTAAPAAAAPVRDLMYVVNVPAGDFLNVRSAPSPTSDLAGTIPPTGIGVQRTGECTGDWCPVKWGHLTGWAKRAFLAN